jgi:hypothetical protein
MLGKFQGVGVGEKNNSKKKPTQLCSIVSIVFPFSIMID